MLTMFISGCQIKENDAAAVAFSASALAMGNEHHQSSSYKVLMEIANISFFFLLNVFVKLYLSKLPNVFV